jgi:hypothetical protein
VVLYFNYSEDIMGLPAYSGGNTRGYRLAGKLYFFEYSSHRGYFLRQVQFDDDTCLDCSDGDSFRDYCITDYNLAVSHYDNLETFYFRFTDRAKSLAVALPSQKEYENNLK